MSIIFSPIKHMFCARKNITEGVSFTHTKYKLLFIIFRIVEKALFSESIVSEISFE